MKKPELKLIAEIRLFNKQEQIDQARTDIAWGRAFVRKGMALNLDHCIAGRANRAITWDWTVREEGNYLGAMLQLATISPACEAESEPVMESFARVRIPLGYTVRPLVIDGRGKYIDALECWRELGAVIKANIRWAKDRVSKADGRKAWAVAGGRRMIYCDSLWPFLPMAMELAKEPGVDILAEGQAGPGMGEGWREFPGLIRFAGEQDLALPPWWRHGGPAVACHFLGNVTSMRAGNHGEVLRKLVPSISRGAWVSTAPDQLVATRAAWDAIPLAEYRRLVAAADLTPTVPVR